MRAFSLLELLIVVTLVAVMSAVLVPLGLEGNQRNAVANTKELLKQGAEAIYGVEMRNDFGFLGDVGKLPSAADLQSVGSLTRGTWTGGVAVGWRGPYAAYQGTAQKDGWGNALRFNANGTITSAGVDGVFDTADDVTRPEIAPILGGVINGRLCLEVFVPLVDGSEMALSAATAASNATAQILAPDATGAATWTASINNATIPCPFYFSAIPPGRRLVKVTGTGGVLSGLAGWATIVIPIGRPAVGKVVLGGAS